MAESTLTVGMDVHRDTISVAVLRDGAHEPELQQTLPNDPRKVERFFRRLEGQGRVVSCYEASACGFVLKRLLDDRQVPCEVVAPIPILLPTKGSPHARLTAQTRGKLIELGGPRGRHPAPR